MQQRCFGNFTPVLEEFQSSTLDLSVYTEVMLQDCSEIL